MSNRITNPQALGGTVICAFTMDSRDPHDLVALVPFGKGQYTEALRDAKKARYKYTGGTTCGSSSQKVQAEVQINTHDMHDGIYAAAYFKNGKWDVQCNDHQNPDDAVFVRDGRAYIVTQLHATFEKQQRSIENLGQGKAKQQHVIEKLGQEKAEQQHVIKNLGQEKGQQQRVIENLNRDKADLNRERAEQQRVIENLNQEKADLNLEKADLNQESFEQQRVIENLNQEKAELEQAVENLSQEKVELEQAVGNLSQETVEQQQVIKHLDQEKAELRQLINNLNTAIQTIGGRQMDMEQLKIDNAYLKERCEQSRTTIQSKDQEIKSLKGELDDTRRFHYEALALSNIREGQSLSDDLFERIHEYDTSNPLSDTDASWIQVRFNDPTDHSCHDDASWVSVDTNDAHCWMIDALFKKDENDEEFYVEARTLVEGSLVRAADGKILKVVDSPTRHETDFVIMLHAGGAKLPLTPKHRVPIFKADEKAEEKYAKDLEKGDFIFVNGIPTQLTMKEEIEVTETPEVVQIRFVPDEPVPVFVAPPSIETKDHRKKNLRRGLNKRSPGEACCTADLKTEGYYTD